ncbi:peptidoglycan DD-metalloendopeptidase family protein [Anaerobacillus sp. MEB173]|uniref:peptidoglycan DD-metalloendopeptidase family protein n=1 Tax=Anaerobacillus sp. MEB173 TaxID=3383345 RepID=UPI003F90E05F
MRLIIEKIASKVVSNCINKLTSLVKNKKLAAGSTACAVLLFSGAGLADNPKINGIETVYHVYIDGDQIGSVDSLQLIDRVVEKKIKEVENEVDEEGFTYVIGEQLEVVPEKVFQVRTKNSQTLELLEDQLSVMVESIVLSVGNKIVGHISSEEEAEEAIAKLKQKYVSETVLESLENKVEIDENEQSLPKPGESVISDVRLSEEITYKEDVAKVEDILTVDKAVKQLTLGTLEDKIHVVQPGDVLGSIAEQYQLSVAEVLAINPTITEGTLLQIGDEINVTDYEPYVYVIVEEKKTAKEEIPFQTETKEDATMWKGDTKVEQKGSPGERTVTYEIIKENGRIVKKSVIEEEITIEPVNKIVIKGTKESTSRGTGQFSWPAVGGYISSYQGTRWGRFHKGIDIARPSNHNILAADNGTVSFAGWDGGYGNKVIINHNNGYSTVYAHLSSIDINVGDTVGSGQKIGVMGSTGNSTGVHLHFEVYKDGNLKNPMDYLNR